MNSTGVFTIRQKLYPQIFFEIIPSLSLVSAEMAEGLRICPLKLPPSPVLWLRGSVRHTLNLYKEPLCGSRSWSFDISWVLSKRLSSHEFSFYSIHTCRMNLLIWLSFAFWESQEFQIIKSLLFLVYKFFTQLTSLLAAHFTIDNLKTPKSLSTFFLEMPSANCPSLPLDKLYFPHNSRTQFH